MTLVGFGIVILAIILLGTRVAYSDISTARQMQQMYEEIKALKRENDFLRGEREKKEAETPN